MKVSIVLSTYNGAKYIKEQLQSLYEQVRPADEVLIFDDQSSDDTVQIIEEFIVNKNIANWVLCVNNINKGWKRNFMDGIDEASGDIIFPCDQDDVWHKDKLLLMEKVMEENSHINVLVSNYLEFFENGKVRCCPKNETGKLTKYGVVKKFMNVEFPGCAYCIRKSFVDKCRKYYDETFPHDAFFWRLAMFDESLYVLERALINQRKHLNSTFTKEANSSRNLEAKKRELIYTKKVIESIYQYTTSVNKLNEFKEEVIKVSSEWTDKRDKLYNTKNIFYWMELIKYISFYPTKKRYLLDLYVIIFT